MKFLDIVKEDLKWSKEVVLFSVLTIVLTVGPSILYKTFGDAWWLLLYPSIVLCIWLFNIKRKMHGN